MQVWIFSLFQDRQKKKEKRGQRVNERIGSARLLLFVELPQDW